jgi:hypothetical protein
VVGEGVRARIARADYDADGVAREVAEVGLPAAYGEMLVLAS